MLSKVLDRVLIMIILTLVACVFISGIRTANAAGETALLSWTHPTQYIDGRTLPLSAIKETRIEKCRAATCAIVADTVTVNAPATSISLPNLICGDWYFRAWTVLTDAAASDKTATVQYQTQISCNKPNPPTGFSVS